MLTHLFSFSSMSDVLASRLGIVGATYASLVPLLSFSCTKGKQWMKIHCVLILGIAEILQKIIQQCVIIQPTNLL